MLGGRPPRGQPLCCGLAAAAALSLDGVGSPRDMGVVALDGRDRTAVPIRRCSLGFGGTEHELLDQLLILWSV